MAENLIFSLEESSKLLAISMEALSQCYESGSGRFCYTELRRQVYLEGWLYGEYIHPDTLSVVKTILQLTEWGLMTADIQYDTLPYELFSACEEAKQLIGMLRVKYCNVLDRLMDIREEIEIERRRLGNGTDRDYRIQSADKSFHRSQSAAGRWSSSATNGADIRNAFWTRFIRPRSPVAFRNNGNDKLKAVHRLELGLVKNSHKTLNSAIRSLSDLLDPAAAFLDALSTLYRPCQMLYSRQQRNGINCSAAMDWGEKIVYDCKRLLLGKMEQQITFCGIEEKLDEDFRKKWRSEIMCHPTDGSLMDAQRIEEVQIFNESRSGWQEG